MRRYVRRGLVNETLSEADLEDLCRVRRLTDLGINLAGVEAILRMRRRIEELQAQVRMIEARRQSGSPSPAMTEVWMVISPDDWGETD